VHARPQHPRGNPARPGSARAPRARLGALRGRRRAPQRAGLGRRSALARGGRLCRRLRRGRGRARGRHGGAARGLQRGRGAGVGAGVAVAAAGQARAGEREVALARGDALRERRRAGRRRLQPLVERRRLPRSTGLKRMVALLEGWPARARLQHTPHSNCPAVRDHAVQLIH